MAVKWLYLGLALYSAVVSIMSFLLADIHRNPWVDAFFFPGTFIFAWTIGAHRDGFVDAKAWFNAVVYICPMAVGIYFVAQDQRRKGTPKRQGDGSGDAV